jgi:REP element-mobilizing transposase RayT
MKRSSYNPDIHHRRSIRLRGYDYSQPNAYFFTVCVQNRELLLVPQDVQDMVQRWWNSLPGKFATIELDEFCTMPNHIHGIVVIVGRIDKATDKAVGAALRGRPLLHPIQSGQPHGVAPTAALGEIIGWFKTMTTNEYIRGTQQNGWSEFLNHFWQRNFFERIIRNKRELYRLRRYIRNNPKKWDIDRENPNRVGEDPEEEWLYQE